jgi:ABC-2 type transport system permease protein
MAELVAWDGRPARWWCAAVTGGREYLAINPPRVVALTLLPRAILQTVFFGLLGRLVGGDELRWYAFVGAATFTMTLSTTVAIAEVPGQDKWSGTMWRIRTGMLAPFTAFVLRSWPYPVVGFGLAVLTWLVAAPMVGVGWPVAQLIPLLPCLAVVALSSSTIGLAGAAFAVGRRADILVGNLLAYAMLLCSAALLPPGRIGWADALGQVIPMRHGLAAIRAIQEHRPFATELVAEVAVGAGWLAVAWALVRVQLYRARLHGHDDFL